MGVVGVAVTGVVETVAQAATALTTDATINAAVAANEALR
jgi:hypothetical protein